MNLADLKIVQSTEAKPLTVPELLKELGTLRIDPHAELEPPQIALAQGDGMHIIGTLGNFSLIIGKAKSRKSFFINVLVSASLSDDPVCGFVGQLPPDKNKILLFDTEQGKYHVQQALKRITRLSGSETSEDLHVYTLRPKKPADRLKLIETAIMNTEGVGLVVIDGVRDVVTSINDEEQATMLSSKLLKWTEEKNIHIITVLHQNKSDNNARGHLGTELLNKAETVLSVTKADNAPDISVVTPEYCRGKEPQPFAFEIDEEGLPVVAENYEIRTSDNRKVDVSELEDHKVYQLLTEVFSHGEEFGYSELVRQMKLAFKNRFNKPIGDNKTKDLITIAKNNDWLLQKKNKAPYTLGEYKKTLVYDDNNDNGIDF